jgi:hypothetical protein
MHKKKCGLVLKLRRLKALGGGLKDIGGLDGSFFFFKGFGQKKEPGTLVDVAAGSVFEAAQRLFWALLRQCAALLIHIANRDPGFFHMLFPVFRPLFRFAPALFGLGPAI